MRNLVLTLMLVASCHFLSEAQISFGIKAGSAIASRPNTNYTFANRTSPRNEFTFNVSNVNNGIFAGVFADLKLDPKFFLRTEAIYHEQHLDYITQYTFETRGRSSAENIYTEKSQRLDIPVSIGVNLGMVEVNSGIMTRLLLNQESGIDVVEGLSRNPNRLTMGFQSGIGLNIQNLNIGLTYQMDFDNYGAHIEIDGADLDLQNSPTRLMASIGYRF